MVTKQICYCEYCGKSFAGENSADECMLHESCHVKGIIADQIEAYCLPNSDTASGVIMPEAIVVPFSSKGMNVMNTGKHYGVYKIVRHFDSDDSAEYKKNNARETAKGISNSDLFFTMKCESAADKKD